MGGTAVMVCLVVLGKRVKKLLLLVEEEEVLKVAEVAAAMMGVKVVVLATQVMEAMAP
jgi:hypothetical protein